MKKLAIYTVPFLAALMLVGPTQTPSARAADIAPVEADVAPVPAESGWTYELTPYGWLPGIKGDVGLFGAAPVAIDVKFKDLFNALDWGNFPAIFMLYGEARNDRFGVFADVLHLALNVGASRVGPPPFSANLDLEVTLATALGFYRVAEDGMSHLDILAGGRLWSVDADLALALGPLGGAASDNETWVDPVIGLKGQYAFNDKIFIKGWGMIGGFGVSSDFMWDVFGGLGYQFTDRFSATAGWRHVGVDYSNGAFLFDVDIDGPIIEGSFRF